MDNKNNNHKNNLHNNKTNGKNGNHKNDNKNKQIQTNKKISSILDSIKVICDSIKKKQELNTQIK